MKLIIVASFFIVASHLTTSTAMDYVARLQPEYDLINVDSYLKNDRLFALQMNCIIFDGPCDAVGQWLKPRVPKALLGECLLCTPKQTQNMNKILEFVQEKRPDLYRAAITKYLENSGITVSDDEKKKAKILEDQINREN